MANLLNILPSTNTSPPHEPLPVRLPPPGHVVRRGYQRIQQFTGSARHLVHRLVECLCVCLRWRIEARELANEL